AEKGDKQEEEEEATATVAAADDWDERFRCRRSQVLDFGNEVDVLDAAGTAEDGTRRRLTGAICADEGATDRSEGNCTAKVRAESERRADRSEAGGRRARRRLSTAAPCRCVELRRSGAGIDRRREGLSAVCAAVASADFSTPRQ